MIIWFDKSMQIHVDKTYSADNPFTLANYDALDDVIYFKANAVVNGSTVTFTQSQVTSEGGKHAYGNYCSNSTGRKHFLNRELKKMESAIASYLRKDRGYRGKITVRFRIGRTTQEFFEELGYHYVGDSDSTGSEYWWSNHCNYVLVEKTI